MGTRNDQVFQLSLTEIAFTITFLLLLLLGYLVFREQAAREAAEAALARVQKTSQAADALDDAERDLGAALRSSGAADPEKVITELVEATDVRAERDRLRKEVADLDARLTALVELQKQLAAVAPADRPEISKDAVLSALALEGRLREVFDGETAPFPGMPEKPGAPETGPSGQQRDDVDLQRVKDAVAVTRELRQQLQSRLNQTVAPGQEAQAIGPLVDAASRYAASASGAASNARAANETADLRGQVAFLQNRLGAHGGRDFPPCWADDDGKVEFLFAIELRPGSVSVTPAWPARRDAAARALPGMADVLAGPYSDQEFERRIKPIFDESRTRSPECRHFVMLKSSITDAVQSDRARLMIEGYFYKTEVRR